MLFVSVDTVFLQMTLVTLKMFLQLSIFQRRSLFIFLSVTMESAQNSPHFYTEWMNVNVYSWWNSNWFWLVVAYQAKGTRFVSSEAPSFVKSTVLFLWDSWNIKILHCLFLFSRRSRKNSGRISFSQPRPQEKKYLGIVIRQHNHLYFIVSCLLLEYIQS